MIQHFHIYDLSVKKKKKRKAIKAEIRTFSNDREKLMISRRDLMGLLVLCQF